jgi:cyclopropane-fatty-acyl-phospholipid synthase
MLKGLGEKLEEKAMVSFLKRFDANPFKVKFKDNEYLIGEGEPTFTVDLKEPIPVSKLMESTSIALGEAYMDGTLVIEGDLYYALNHFLGQMDSFSTSGDVLSKLTHNPLTKKKQAEEVQSHYDIGNDFYKLWLDETMCYSCAYFKTPEDTLYQAQVNKVDRILEKLYLHEGDRLLDIGCGWGFLLIEAAKKYKIKGTGITLSHEQYDEFNRRIKDQHLEDYLTVKLMDYRDLPKSGLKFDRVVSVGMVEHVGRDNYQLFNDCVDAVLEDGGLFLLHFISGMHEKPGDAWMSKYIFPGGMLPSLREMITDMTEDNFHVQDVENLRMHYNMTLLEWDKNFRAQLDKVRTMFDERFIRMWDLYLNGCAAGFYTGMMDLHQILVTKGVNNKLPITRWY